MTIEINSPQELREALLDYCGTGWTATGSPIAVGYLSKIQNASTEELICIAEDLGLLG